jgi:tRNA threonylcarbamoyl adenosine modification protein YjeE
MTRTLSEAELIRLGESLGQRLPTGRVIWLTGELGAGKTTFARALARGRGCREAATSPTFALVHRYEGPAGPVFHLDCYRLRHPDEAAELDWEGLSQGDLLLIEWPERAGEWVPRPDVSIVLAHAGDLDTRTVGIEPDLEGL